MTEQEQRLPGDLIYGNSHAVSTALERPLRCETDPRWRWPETPEGLPAQELAVIDTALVQHGKLYHLPVPITAEMLAIDKRNSPMTYAIDTRPEPDVRLMDTWRGKYRHIGPRGRFDLAWALKMGLHIILLGRYVESSIEEQEAS